jgi:hypothetical protein
VLLIVTGTGYVAALAAELNRPGGSSPSTPPRRHIVEKLSDAWGVREHTTTAGKTVWAEVACDGADAISCAAARGHS